MASDREHVEPSQPWADIPDPFAGSAEPLRSLPNVPAVASRTRANVLLQRKVALGGALVWLAGALAVLGVRPALTSDSTGFLLGSLVLWGGLAALVLGVTLARGQRGLGGSVATVAVAALGAPLVFMLVSLAWLAPEDPGTSLGELGPPKAFLNCLVIGCAILAPVLGLTAWGLRRAFPSGAPIRAAALAAAAGLGTALVMTLHCRITAGGHVALAHGLPMVLSGGLGAWLGARFLRA